MKIKNIKNKSKELSTIGFITVFLLASFWIFTPFKINVTKENENYFGIEEDSSSISVSAGEGLDPWWNEYFRFRRCINLTNNNDDNLTNFRTYIEIDTTDLIPDKMQADLGDIRIVENGVLRDYYCTLDGTTARIWFKTNISAQASEYDTYLYYGNTTCSYDPSYYKEYEFGRAWYTFDDDTVLGSTSIVKDKMGHQVVNPSAYDHDATLYGLGVNPQVGYKEESVNGKSIKFNDTQTAAYMSAPYTLLNGLTDFTICFWAKRQSAGTEYIISGTTGTNHNYMLMDAPSIQEWSFYVWRRGTSGTHIYTNNLPTDGLIYSNPGSPIIIASGGLIIAQEQDSLGGGFDASQAYCGYIDEMRFFDYGISDDEMTWLYERTELAFELLEERIRAADVTIVVKDVDGRRITDGKATVYFWNASDNTQLIQSHTAGYDGTALFTDVAYDNYTITVNYTKTLPDLSVKKLQIYNSSNKGGDIEFSGLIYTEHLITDLWTIDFRVLDANGIRVNMGYIVIYDEDDSALANLTLDANGEARFIWENRTGGYDYSIYYINSDITPRITLIKEGTVRPVDKTDTLIVSEKNKKNSGESEYEVQESLYVNGSSLISRGENTVIDARIEMTGMNTGIDIVQVEFYDIDLGSTEEIIDYKSYSDSRTELSLVYRAAEDYDYDVYGIKLDVVGSNSSECLGVIKITLTYARVEEITVDIARMNIKIVDSQFFNPVTGLTVKVYLTGTETLVSNSLKTGADGFARGQSTGMAFWYNISLDYNITIWQTQSLQYQFYVNQSDQSYDSSLLWGYNYSLPAGSIDLILAVRFGDDNFITRFTNGTEEGSPIQEYLWGQDIDISIIFSYSDNGETGPWYGDEGPDSDVTCTIYDQSKVVVYSQDMSQDGDGIYSISIDSSLLSAGYEGNYYEVWITALKYTYFPPKEDIRVVKINPLPTGLTLYEYDPSDPTPDELAKKPTSKKYFASVYYGRTLNITMRYFDSSSGTTLSPDIYSFYWEDDSGAISGNLIQDTIHTNYWVLPFESLQATDSREYSIRVTIGLENHSIKEDYEFFITVLAKHTEVNGSSRVTPKFEASIWVREEVLYYFEYNDSDDSTRLGNLDEFSAEIFYEDDDGNETFVFSTLLDESAEKIHILDVGTGDLSVGTYNIYIAFQKTQYVSKTVIFTLNVLNRPIYTGYEEIFTSIEQGSAYRITLNLTDPSNSSVPITGANIYITGSFGNLSFTETQTPGIYYLDFPTSRYDTFFQPITIRGRIYMEKELHETTEISVVLTIEMPKVGGIPTFYLIMIISAVVAVAGSLGAYRYVQLRRIPKFIKKGKALIKAINSKGSLSKSMGYPSKEEFLAKMFEDRWKIHDLSLRDKLGVTKDKKLGKTIGAGAGGDLKNIKGGDDV
ncbi:MAG: hypothetical protein JW891_08150 [Candidatus Lokiarchaeota archaeon]|nr:hypothetical protein [Candidatus Lokiarchaeota archaeon]